MAMPMNGLKNVAGNIDMEPDKNDMLAQTLVG